MGYLLNDNTASGGEKREYDTVSCKHCQAIIKVQKKSGNWCWQCGGPVCTSRACTIRCTPFFKRVEEKMRRQQLFKSMGLS